MDNLYKKAFSSKTAVWVGENLQWFFIHLTTFISQADVDSLGTSFADYEDATKFMEAQINPLTGKRKRGRPRKYKPSTSQDYIDVGLEARSPSDFVEEGNSRSNLEDDLQYSSDDELEVEEDEDDWQEVDNENITVTVAGDGRQFTADDQVRQTLLLHFLNFPTAVALIILYTGDVHAHP